VQQIVPADKLLVVSLEEGLGWEQICPWLGVEIPVTPYPRGNDAFQFQAQARKDMVAQIVRTRKNIVKYFVAPSLTVGVFAYLLVALL
jgi:hypothetical protein